MILDDPYLIDKIIERIKTERVSPEYIVDDEISKYQNMMSVGNDDYYLNERLNDIEDIKQE